MYDEIATEGKFGRGSKRGEERQVPRVWEARETIGRRARALWMCVYVIVWEGRCEEGGIDVDSRKSCPASTCRDASTPPERSACFLLSFPCHAPPTSAGVKPEVKSKCGCKRSNKVDREIALYQKTASLVRSGAKAKRREKENTKGRRRGTGGGKDAAYSNIGRKARVKSRPQGGLRTRTGVAQNRLLQTSPCHCRGGCPWCYEDTHWERERAKEQSAQFIVVSHSAPREAHKRKGRKSDKDGDPCT